MEEILPNGDLTYGEIARLNTLLRSISESGMLCPRLLEVFEEELRHNYVLKDMHREDFYSEVTHLDDDECFNLAAQELIKNYRQVKNLKDALEVVGALLLLFRAMKEGEDELVVV